MDRRFARKAFPVRLAPLPLAVSLAVGGLFAGLSSPSAEAACTAFTPSTAVTCNGAIIAVNSAAANMVVTFDGTARISSLINGLASATFTGNNTEVINNGEINPSTFGDIISLSSGLFIGNNNNNLQVITNNGTLRGTSGSVLVPNLIGLTGMAIEVRNGGAGTTTITNSSSGTISGRPLIGITGLADADIPVVAVAGGKVVMTNSGTITGRISFAASATGNTFTNIGTLTGSLSMGAAAGVNRFNAITGSSVAQGSGTAATLAIQGQSANFAAAGVVDAGIATNSILVLQNAVGGGTGSGGSGNIYSDNFKNFSNLIVEAGTWRMFGAVLSGTTTTVLKDGVLMLDNGGALGGGTITSSGQGGTLQANAATVTLNNAIDITGTRLAVSGNNTLRLDGIISGSGSLNKSGTGP